MLTIGERLINEPLNNTSLAMNYNKFYFTCKVDKSYGEDQPIAFIFEFEDGSSIYYNRTEDTITPLKQYGDALKFKIEDAHAVYEKRLKRLMLQSKNKYIAKGRYADYDNYSR